MNNDVWTVKYEDREIKLDGEQYVILKQLALDDPVAAEKMALELLKAQQ